MKEENIWLITIKRDIEGKTAFKKLNIQQNQSGYGSTAYVMSKMTLRQVEQKQ